jgi:phage pi2 protein 07
LIPWIIIRTDIAKELYVARQIALAGFDAWVPMEYRSERANRLTRKRRNITEHPVLPKRLFAAVPVTVCGELMGMRHVAAIEFDAAYNPVQIPCRQIAIFRDEIDKLNAEIMALNAIATRKTKAKWKNMRDALQDLVQQAKAEMEIAA